MSIVNPSLELKAQRAERNRIYRAKRKAVKRAYVELHHQIVAVEQESNANFKFGFTKRRLKRDGKWVDLPHEYAFILKACEEFITNPQRFPGLFLFGGTAINNIQCRTLIAKVLACILPNTDLIGGRIGMPTVAGLKTISYDQLQEDYALRWGEFISPKSFAKVMKYLRRAGYLQTERINVCVDKEEGTVRSAAGYKQLTGTFFKDLKVTAYKEICELIIESRKRDMKKGLDFSWLNFRTIASGVQEIFNATKLNKSAEFISSLIFGTHGSLPSHSPH